MLSSFAAGRLFGERSGEPPARLLALHGWGRTRRDFAAVLDGLPAVALDLPGFGASPPPPAAWGSAEYAAEVAIAAAELVDAARRAADLVAAGAAHPPRAGAPGGLVVIGHSFGGCVAVQLAAAHPELVAGLVLSGVPRLAPRTRTARPALAFRAGRALHRVGLLSERRLEEARRRYGSADYRAAEGVMRQVLVRVLAEQLEDRLPALSCPVRLVWGATDTAAPPAEAEAAAGRIADARLEVLPGVGHLVPLESPQPLRTAAVELLGRSG